MPFSKILPDGYENDYKTKYLVRHLPDPTSDDPTLRAGTIYPVFAYLLGQNWAWNAYGQDWDWMPLADYWAGAAGVPTDGKADELRAEIATLNEKLDECADRLHGLEFRLACTESEHVDHEKDYLGVWKALEKRPHENVVDAAKRAMAENAALKAEVTRLRTGIFDAFQFLRELDDEGNFRSNRTEALEAKLEKAIAR